MTDIDVFPDVVRIEASSACNFDCIHCSNGQGHPQRGGVLKEEMFQLVLDQFREKNFIPRVLVLYHGGEPLINRNLPLFIEEAKEYGISRIKIVTNCSLLTEDKSVDLISAGITDIDMSFDGLSAEENNFIRKNGNFDRDSANALGFIECARRMNKEIRIRIGNVQIMSVDEVCEDRLIRSVPKYLLDRFHSQMDYIEFESYPAYFWPDYQPSEFFDVGVCKSEKNNDVNYCENLFETISILNNGDVVPCCYDIGGTNVFGNVCNDNIFSIWSSEKAVEFRASVKKGLPTQFCNKCHIFSGNYLVKRSSYPF